MKKAIFIGLFSLLMMSCSSPKNIVLTDGSVIKTKDEPEYKKKTDSYQYEDKQGNKGTVNASSVKVIQPIDAEIPKPEKEEPPVEEAAAASEVKVEEPKEEIPAK